MKRRNLSRRALAGLPPGPLFRDIHPDREAVFVHDDDGTLIMVGDLPTSMMNGVRFLAKRDGVPVQKVLATVLRDALDKQERGF